MLKDILKKNLETLLSILPIVFVVSVLFIVSLFVKDLSSISGDPLISTKVFVVFLVSAVFLVFGSSLFQLGADNALAKVGTYIGASLTKKGSIVLLSVMSGLIVFLVTIAEPDLSMLGDQLKGALNPWILKAIVGLGVSIFFVTALIRIILQKSTKYLLLTSYFIIFAIGCFYGPSEESSPFIALAFDASGVTTGSATIPFVIAFGASVALVRGGKDPTSDSFGVSGILSIGPILSMLLVCLPLKSGLNLITSPSQIDSIGAVCLSNITDVLLGILPIFFFFLIYNFFFLKLEKKELIKILIGFGYTLVGLYLFVVAAQVGFLPLGNELGINIASNEKIYYLFIIIALVVGVFIVLAEPSIQILVQQVKDITGGAIKKPEMLIALSIGVSLGVLLEFLRIVYWRFSIIYYLVPVYTLALLLTFFIPDLYTAVAFDSGGVASGTLAASFLLPITIGAASQINEINKNNIGFTKISGFGVVGMVCAFSLISIELLGVVAKIKVILLNKMARKRLYQENDDQIIHFGVSGVNNEKIN